jgi:tetratricopeptide (TPR) repeat protein
MDRAAKLASTAVGFALCTALAGCADLEARRFYRAGTDALDRGESQRAVAELERAAALAPEISAIQNHLGIAYEDAGRSDDALLAYERAVALDCDNRAAESNLRELRARRADDSRSSPDGEQVHDSRSSPDGEQVHDSRSSPDGDEPNTGQVAR